MSVVAEVFFKVEAETLDEALALVAEKAKEKFGDDDFVILQISGDADDDLWVGKVGKELDSTLSVSDRRIAQQVGHLPISIADPLGQFLTETMRARKKS
jgi:hypothetical protein